MGNESDVIVETKNLTKTYRDFWGRQKVRALKALDLEIRRGEIFGLLGPNGSGKTTTIKLLLGLLFPTSGEVNILGRPASDVAKNERIGYLPEESYLYRFLNAEETLDFYGRLFKIPSAIRRQKVAQLIQMVGLDTANKRQLREYSKGMTRRLGLAQALINDPDLIVLDEPTSGLDPIGTRNMKTEFETELDYCFANPYMKRVFDMLKEQGKTIIMSSHLLGDVQDVCDRVGILYQGELKELGRVEDLLKIVEQTEIRVAGLSDEAKRKIEKIIEEDKSRLVFCGNPTTSLEDLFHDIIAESEARPGKRVRGGENGK